MWEPKWAREIHFTYLISGLALRCQYGWSHRFFHITLTTSWALLSTVLISGETPLYTLIDTRCLSCLRCEDCGNHFFGIWSKLLPRISHTRDRLAIFDVALLKRNNVAKVRINGTEQKRRKLIWGGQLGRTKVHCNTTGRKYRKTAVVLHSLTKESFYLNVKHVCMWASVM